MHSFTYKLLPEAFNDTWTTNADMRALRGGGAGVGDGPHDEGGPYIGPNLEPRHNLRDDDNYHISFYRTDQLSRFPLFNFPRIWNDLPIDLKVLPSKKQFLVNIKLYFVNKLNDTDYCTRLLCPVCHLRV